MTTTPQIDEEARAAAKEFLGDPDHLTTAMRELLLIRLEATISRRYAPKIAALQKDRANWRELAKALMLKVNHNLSCEMHYTEDGACSCGVIRFQDRFNELEKGQQ